MSDKRRRVAVCIGNEGFEESLELRKLYEVLDDPAGQKRNLIRVIDEEGEDYLYPEQWFLGIELPQSIEDALVELVHSSPQW
jgi:hypothetical protein